MYRPTDGYIDLSQKPPGMTRKTHKKIQDMQMELIREAQKYRDPAVKEANLTTFQRLQHHMAELQFIIVRHWQI